MVGEWLLKTSYEAPDLIIFRSDNKYFVYNDMDFMGRPGNTAKYEIVFDNKATTALTETGKWYYNPVDSGITLTDRNFIKEVSEFNSYYGKKESLVFKVKKMSNEELTLCLTDKKNKCDTYIMNANFTGDPNKTFYQEQTEDYEGTGSQTKEISLSGYETELKLSYEFYKEANQLTITDKSGKELFATEMMSTNGTKTVEIPLRGVTKLVFKVKSSEPSSKWEITAEIK